MHRSARHSRVVTRPLAVALLIAAHGCGSPVETTLSTLVEGETEVSLFSGLVQRVTVTPADPVIGGEIEIRSVLRNTGHASPRFLSNSCRLDLESVLELFTAPDWAECKGLPHQIDLAPGDSNVVVTRQRVSGEAGEHEVRVLHVLEPLHWVPVKIRLRP